jgi:hypothetical protein
MENKLTDLQNLLFKQMALLLNAQQKMAVAVYEYELIKSEAEAINQMAKTVIADATAKLAKASATATALAAR